MNLKNLFLTGVYLLSSFYLTSTLKADDWTSIKTSLNKDATSSLSIIEAGKKINDKLSSFYFVDIESSKNDALDLESFYSEARLSYKVTNLINIITEYNGGNDFKDLFRFGLMLKPNLGKNNFTLLKLLPIESSGEKGAQVSLLTSQTLGKLTLSLLADYNIKSNTVYTEPTMIYEIKNGFGIFFQARSFDKFGDYNFDFYFGINKNF